MFRLQGHHHQVARIYIYISEGKKKEITYVYFTQSNKLILEENSALQIKTLNFWKSKKNPYI